jgi:hypothetical protein
MAESSSTIIEQPSREELVAAWHRRSPNLTYEQADHVFDDWLPCLDFYRDDKGEWQVKLKAIRPRQ